MAFKLQASSSGLGRTCSGLSIHAAPYRVDFKNGKKEFFARLSDIYGSVALSSVLSVFDRHKKAHLDLETLWQRHRRRFIRV